MYAVKDDQGNVTRYFDDIVKAEGFHANVQSTQNNHDTFIQCSDEPGIYSPYITIDEFRMTLQYMSRDKVATEDAIPADLFKDVGYIMLRKLGVFIPNAERIEVCQRAGRMPTLY